jgi:hypothetical protein
LTLGTRQPIRDARHGVCFAEINYTRQADRQQWSVVADEARLGRVIDTPGTILLARLEDVVVDHG